MLTELVVKTVETLVEKEQYDQALNYLEMVANDQSDTEFTHLIEARIFAANGQIDRALESVNNYFSFKGATRSVPFRNNPHIFVHTCVFRGQLYLELGQPGVAITSIDMALYCDPNSELARLNRGIGLIELGRLNDAVETLRAVVEAKPSNQEARLYLSLAHKQLGNSTLATETLAGLDHAKLARRGDIKLASRLARQLGLGTANMEVSPPIVNSGENIKSRVLLVVNKIVDYGARLKHGPRIVEPNPIMFFLNLSACLFAIGMRLFYPLIRIRIRGLYGSRIGHMVIENIAYLGERKAGLHGGKRHLNLFYFDGPICNHQFAKMLKKRLPISEFFHQVDSYSSVLPHNKRHYAPIIAKDIYKMRDVEGYMADPTLMNFTPSELRRGWRELAGMGIDRANPYVCFHGRDSAYLKEWRSDIDTSYHDYRDSKIENFLGMANSLIDRGYRVVRMGSAVEQALPAGSEHLIDYATNFRTDFLDIFLMAHCSFMVSGDGGLKHLPVCFGRPLVSVDKVIMHTIETFVNNLLFTPKKIWLISDKRFLSFNEMVNTPVGGFYRTDQYTENGLEVIANSGEDIEAVSLEMDDRLDGKWVPVEEDEELQNRYWSLWDGLWPQVRDRRPSARIGAEFLRRNVDLLN